MTYVVPPHIVWQWRISGRHFSTSLLGDSACQIVPALHEAAIWAMPDPHVPNGLDSSHYIWFMLELGIHDPMKMAEVSIYPLSRLNSSETSTPVSPLCQFGKGENPGTLPHHWGKPWDPAVLSLPLRAASPVYAVFPMA